MFLADITNNYNVGLYACFEFKEDVVDTYTFLAFNSHIYIVYEYDDSNENLCLFLKLNNSVYSCNRLKHNILYDIFSTKTIIIFPLFFVYLVGITQRNQIDDSCSIVRGFRRILSDDVRVSDEDRDNYYMNK